MNTRESMESMKTEEVYIKKLIKHQLNIHDSQISIE